MSKLVATIRDLIVAWYHADRIRVSPTTGRLLALQVGDRFVFRDESFEVVEREVNETPNGNVIAYRLDGSLGRSVLTVQQSCDQDNVSGQLITLGQRDQKCTSVFNDEVALLRCPEINLETESR